MDECVAQLSSSLAEQGLHHDAAVDISLLPSLLSQLSPSSHPFLLNLLHQLHSSLASNRQSLSSLQSTHSSLLSSHSSLHSQLSELQDAHADVDRRLWETEMRRRHEEAEWAAKERAMRLQQAEVERRALMVQHRDRQYRHERRKAELDADKMSERLLKLLQEKGAREGREGREGREREAGSCCVNEGGKGREGKRREAGSVDLTARMRHREELQRVELQVENAAIKAYLLDLDAQLAALAPQPAALDDKVAEGVAVEQSPSKRKTGEGGLAELPWRLLQRGLQRRLTQRMQALGSKATSGRAAAESQLTASPTRPPAPCTHCAQLRAEVQSLQRDVEEQRAVVSSQHALLVSHLFTAPHPLPLSPTIRRLSLDHDLSDLLHVHKQAQATLALNRAHLQAEREQWEEEKRRRDWGGGSGAGMSGELAVMTPVRGRGGRLAVEREHSSSTSPPSSPGLWDDEEEGEREDGEAASIVR